MNNQELAAKLNNREYRNETTNSEEREAKKAGLVIVFGASDDLMEFRGAIHDEFDCYGGGSVYLTHVGLLTNECENEDCPHFERLKKTATTINAVWGTEGYSWVYKTAIPHATFDILEDGEKYYRGIVFALADVSA